MPLGSLSYYATLARQVGPGDLARAVARRANRLARHALRPDVYHWTPASLEARGFDAAARQAALLGPVPELRGSIARALSEVPAARDRAVARAGQALARRFRVFGTEVDFAHGPIDWHLDPSSGHRYSLSPSSQLSLLKGGADPKFPWALGRLEQLVALAQGHCVTGEARFGNELVTQVTDFLANNPIGQGIHWTCPMEVSLRAANLALALQMVAGHPQVEARDFCLSALASLIEHATFVVENLEDGGAVPNNHLVANFAGLLVVGALFPSLPGAERWVQLAASGLREQLAAQVHLDGTSFEGSVPYHRLAVELFTLPYVVGRRAGIDLGALFDERLQRMFRVAHAYCSEHGLAPQIGDNDSGRALPFTDRLSLDHGYLAPLGAGLFADGSLKSPDVPVPDELLWLLGEKGLRRFERLPSRGRPGAFRSDASGLHVLRGAGAVLTVSAGPKGQRGVGGHNHCDKLSFELHLAGVPVIVDPGTFTYSADPAVRNAYRGTARHNVVQVDGLEQSPLDPSRLFALPDVEGCTVTAFEGGDTVDRFAARYQLFPAAGEAVQIERTFWLDTRARGLAVADRLLGEGARDLQSRLYLPDAEARRRDATEQERAACRAVASSRVEVGAVAVELGPVEQPHAVVLFAPGTEIEIESAPYSPGYGEQRPAACVRVHGRTVLPASLGFVVLFKAFEPSRLPPSGR